MAAGTLSEGKRILLYPGERGKGIRRVRRRILGEPVRLGHAGAVDYEWVSGSGDPDGEGNVSDGAGTGEGSLEKGKLIHAWRFDRDTGSCMEGAGTLKVTGVGRTRTITVYKENGRVDISNVK